MLKINQILIFKIIFLYFVIFIFIFNFFSASQQLALTYEKLHYIRDLRNCIMGAASKCDNALFYEISKKTVQPLNSISSRLSAALSTSGADKMKSEQMLYLIQETGKLFYSIEYMSVEVPRAHYKCLRSLFDRNFECQKTHQQRGGHNFKIVSV